MVRYLLVADEAEVAKANALLPFKWPTQHHGSVFNYESLKIEHVIARNFAFLRIMQDSKEINVFVNELRKLAEFMHSRD